MRELFGAVLMGVCAMWCLGVPVGAQDMDAMMKWTVAEVVHYDVVAEFAGSTFVLKAPAGAAVPGYTTQVKDRYEMGFDWSPSKMALVGAPTFRNFPATLPNGMPGGTSMGRGCPPPKVNGTFDFVEIVGAKTGLPGSNSLQLSTARNYPAGSVPYALDGPCALWLDLAKNTQPVSMGMIVPPGMYFAMPAAAGKTITVGKDGKTMTLVDKANGWTYTYTLRIVK